MKLGFLLALKLFAIIELGHVIAVAAMVPMGVASYEIITFFVQIVGYILLWKYFVLDAGTFLMITIIFGLINTVLGSLILAFLAGLLKVAI